MPRTTNSYIEDWYSTRESRIKGMPYQGQLIQIEGIALAGDARRQRRRIMPEGSWDWSIPVPLSQGWRTGDRVFVGGQISADKQATLRDLRKLVQALHPVRLRPTGRTRARDASLRTTLTPGAIPVALSPDAAR